MAAVQQRGYQGGQPFGRMAQVRIHDDDDPAACQRNAGRDRTRRVRFFPVLDQPDICVLRPGPRPAGCAITRAAVNKNDFKTVGGQIQCKQARQ